MSKIKISMKDIPVPVNRIFRAGYCDLCYIIAEDPKFYNAGIYGWNCDIYVNYEYNIAITTGYRNMRGERIPGELLKKYDQRGRELYRHQFEFFNFFDQRQQISNEFWGDLNDLLKREAIK